jgi:hypothetical protein
MAQVVECLPGKHMALNSNLSTTKKQQKQPGIKVIQKNLKHIKIFLKYINSYVLVFGTLPSTHY